MRDLGYPVALCQATAFSRRYGWAMAVGEEDQCCIGGVRTRGLDSEGAGGPFNEDKQLELGKYKYHSTQDHELIFTIPKSKVEVVADGLENTHKMGFRYPVITDIRHRPNLSPFLDILGKAKTV